MVVLPSFFIPILYFLSLQNVSVSNETNIPLKHTRWQTVALILSSYLSLYSSLSLSLSLGKYIILYHSRNRRFPFFRLITDLIIHPYTHLLAYLLFFSVVRILLLAGRNKKNFIRLQIGHLFSINLQLWHKRNLFYALSLSFLRHFTILGTLLFQLNLIGKPKKATL